MGELILNKCYSERIYPHQKWQLPEYQDNHGFVELLRKTEEKVLNRAEKDKIFSLLEESFYNHNGQCFMIGGYYHDFKGLLKRYIVNIKNLGFVEKFAVDKSSIRNFYKHRCVEILEG